MKDVFANDKPANLFPGAITSATASFSASVSLIRSFMPVNVIVGHHRADSAYEVGEGGYRRPRNNMVSAGILTDADGANRHALHRPGERSDRHRVAGIHTVLELNKNAGNNIFDRGLRAK